MGYNVRGVLTKKYNKTSTINNKRTSKIIKGQQKQLVSYDSVRENNVVLVVLLLFIAVCYGRVFLSFALLIISPQPLITGRCR